MPLRPRIPDYLTDAVLLFDPSCCLMYINVAGEVLFGVSARQMCGMQAREIFPYQEKTIEQELQRVLEEGESLTKHNISLELPSHPLVVNITLVPILEQDQPVAVLVQIESVSRHLRISMEEQLVAQQNAARMLLRGLAHEIKNPLGGLRGAAQLLERELTDPELKEYTQIIMEESDRLQSLVDRMVGPQKPPCKARLNIHRVLERVRQLVQAESPPDVHFRRDYDPSLPDVDGDSDQLIQAILNIVRNAAQAVGQKGAILIRTRLDRHVTIGLQRYRMTVRIDIIDDGPGVPPELVGQIFYPMVTGRADGSGLGLSIAQSLIHQHGGVIECSSEPGHTVFSVYLPLEIGP